MCLSVCLSVSLSVSLSLSHTFRPCRRPPPNARKTPSAAASCAPVVSASPVHLRVRHNTHPYTLLANPCFAARGEGGPCLTQVGGGGRAPLTSLLLPPSPACYTPPSDAPYPPPAALPAAAGSSSAARQHGCLRNVSEGEDGEGDGGCERHRLGQKFET